MAEEKDRVILHRFRPHVPNAPKKTSEDYLKDVEKGQWYTEDGKPISGEEAKRFIEEYQKKCDS